MDPSEPDWGPYLGMLAQLRLKLLAYLSIALHSCVTQDQIRENLCKSRFNLIVHRYCILVLLRQPIFRLKTFTHFYLS